MRATPATEGELAYLREHDTVGRTFTCSGAVYRCTGYDPSMGYWMQIETGRDELLEVGPGHRTNVSERAIGRTFHRRWRDESTTPHDPDCRCWICRGEERP
jgi:hypothetical protein